MRIKPTKAVKPAAATYRDGKNAKQKHTSDENSNQRKQRPHAATLPTVLFDSDGVARCQRMGLAVVGSGSLVAL